MLIFFRSICAILVMATVAGCASSSSADKNRPSVYQGGEYYGDAWHASDADSRIGQR
jgi:hypothetical protein